MIGQPQSRVDGPLKVSGRATYAYERWNEGQPLYGFIAGATIGRGRITRIDAGRAERAAGVRAVLTHLNAPPQGAPDLNVFSQYSRARPQLASPDVSHYGQAIALVVADTFERARAAARLVGVEYAPSPGGFDLDAGLGRAYAPKRVNAGMPTDTAVGDLDAGLAGSEVKLDLTYTTPYEMSQPMEPHACMAVPHGDALTVYVCTQLAGEARQSIAATLQMDVAKIRVVTPYVGGGFGSKLGIHAETVLASLAARLLGNPVKVALARQQIFHLVGNRPTTRQRVRLGAGRDGRLVALGHDVFMSTSPMLEYAEQTASTSRALYAAPHRLTRHRLVPLDMPPGEDVRAPGEAPGMLAIESAMDELAHALGMDPVELRVKNEPSVHPENGRPYSDRHLIECLREGARRFGWERRPARPASARDGRWLVGWGMAAGIRKHFQMPMRARVRLEPGGAVVVQADMTDLGTGTYTIAAQVAAETLGVPVARVRVELGDTDLPTTAGSGGSWGGAGIATAVQRACAELRAKGGGAVPQSHPHGLEAEGQVGSMRDDPNYKAYSLNTYGAFFVEVGVDADTGEVRLRRVLGVFDCGRILNPKTARSQMIGGITFGISQALHEQAVVDQRSGAFVNHDLAEYLVPVHADIPPIEVAFLDTFDDKANPLGAKGLGELGVCGSGAAVANAVFNATGVRVRDFPITMEKLLGGLPAQEM